MPVKQENIAYYLKYRPQSLDSLVGQDLVKKTLISAFLNGKLAHGYLFVGPRGTGKTSTARILAKMINCESQGKETDEQSGSLTLATRDYPCNKCQTCISITDGSNLDLIEIDAASNRGIEDIRALREKIKLSPTAAKKKVYIIDEVHMLTTEAFNALLKTLEEPPSHAIFILATTEASKIPKTIVSRVQRLDFKLATPDQLLEALQKIVKEEEINIDEEALKFLVKSSAGSFRDGVKLLDQISTLEGRLTVKVLENLFKSSSFDNLSKLLETFLSRDIKEALLIITKAVEEEIEIKELILYLMDILRNLIFIKNGLGEQLVRDNFSEKEYEDLIKFSNRFENKQLVFDLDVLQKALEKMKVISIPSLPLELAAVEICGSESQIKSDEIRKSEFQEISESVNQKKQDSNTPTNRSTDIPTMSDLSGVPSLSDSSDILKLKEKWTFVLETVRPYNFSLEALLRSINVVECNGSVVVVEVPYSFHQRILEAPKNRELLESILSDILGRGVKVTTILKARPQSLQDLANIEVAADDEIIRAAAEIFASDTIN